MVGEQILAVFYREDTSNFPISIAMTDRGSYELTATGYREVEMAGSSGSILPRGWTSLRIVEVRNLKPSTVIKLDGGKMIIYDSSYNPFEDSVSTSLDFQEEEEARTWQEEYDEMNVLEALPD